MALKALDTGELQSYPRLGICCVEILSTYILDSGTYKASREDLGSDQQSSCMPKCSQDFWKKKQTRKCFVRQISSAASGGKDYAGEPTQ